MGWESTKGLFLTHTLLSLRKINKNNTKNNTDKK